MQIPAQITKCHYCCFKEVLALGATDLSTWQDILKVNGKNAKINEQNVFKLNKKYARTT